MARLQYLTPIILLSQVLSGRAWQPSLLVAGSSFVIPLGRQQHQAIFQADDITIQIFDRVWAVSCCFSIRILSSG